MTERNAERSKNSYNMQLDPEKDKDAYFTSKKLRNAPQITPLAPLTMTNKMINNMRLSQKKRSKKTIGRSTDVLRSYAGPDNIIHHHTQLPSC